MGQDIYEIFGEKSRGPPTSWNELMHNPSQTTAQKHLNLPHLFKTKRTGKIAHITAFWLFHLGILGLKLEDGEGYARNRRGEMCLC